jgi:hypothetical protein
VSLSDLFLRPLFTWRSVVASKHGPKSPITRHVLLTLSLHMSERGDSCFPSTGLLTEETGLGLRTVKEHLALGAGAGWIGKRERRMQNGQGWRRVEYFAQIPPEAEAAFHAEQRGAGAAPPLGGAPAAPAQGGAPDAEGGAHGDTNVVRHPHQSTSKSTSREKEGARARRTPLPDGFAVSDRVKAWAKRKGFDAYLEQHFEHFLGFCRANRSVYADWDEALMNCIRADWGGIRKQAQIEARVRGERPAGPPPTEWWQNFDGVRAKAAELKVERRDMPGAAPWENNLWFKAMVCATAGDGPWCNDRDEVFQRYLHVARKGLVHA